MFSRKWMPVVFLVVFFGIVGGTESLFIPTSDGHIFVIQQIYNLMRYCFGGLIGAMTILALVRSTLK